MNTTSRSAGVLPPGIAAAIAPELPTGPDAELIRLCGEYEALEREIEALYEPEDADDDENDKALGLIMNRISPLLDRMEEIHAQTPAGIHARARVAGVCNPGGGFTWDEDDTVPGRILAVLLRDAMALGGMSS
jgi:hypothetical protein